MEQPQANLSILYRGKKFVLPFQPHQNVWNVKAHLIAEAAAVAAKAASIESTPSNSVVGDVTPNDLKLLFKGKVLANDHNLHDALSHYKVAAAAAAAAAAVSQPFKPAKLYHLLAVGLSSSEVQRLQEANAVVQEHNTKMRLVKDDLSDAGKLLQHRHVAQGRRILKQQQVKASKSSLSTSSPYGFGSIKTLPGLPNEAQARRILQELSQDAAILACMAQHQWQVGTLAELFPDGQVGESPVCVMGLNQNHGAKILLRLRTDDLLGFRKPLSIRKVLYHELAHNVHSDHDDAFFQLMRQIERECNEFSKNNSTSSSSNWASDGKDDNMDSVEYTAGTYRLGGSVGSKQHDVETNLTRRERAARAAEERLSAEEEEIVQNCGCQGNKHVMTPLLSNNLFLPPSSEAPASPLATEQQQQQQQQRISNRSRSDSKLQDGEAMDTVQASGAENDPNSTSPMG